MIRAVRGTPPAYGQLNITNSSAVIAVTAAVDPTLLTNSDYKQVTGVWDAVPHGLNRGITQQTNSFTVGVGGHYYIEAWMTLSSNQANNNLAIRFAVNGVISLVRRPRTKVNQAADRINLSAHGFVPFNTGDVVTLWIASDKSANITIEDAVFSTQRLA